MEKALCERMTENGPCLGYAKGGQRLCRAHLGQFNEFINDRGDGVKQGIAEVKQSLRDARHTNDTTEKLLACLEAHFQVHTAPAQSRQHTLPPLGYRDGNSPRPAVKPIAALPTTPQPMPDSGVELVAYDPDCDVELISPDLSAEPLVLDSHRAQRTDETHVPITTVSPELLTEAARRYSMIDGMVVSAVVSRMNASQKSNCVVIDPSTASRFLIRDDATAPELRVREDTVAEVTRSRRAAIVAHVGHPEAGHYICICVDPAERKVVVYDSLPTVDAFSVAIANIAHAVQSRIPGSAELTYAVGYSRQAAGSNDCALYALNQAWRFTSGGEFGLTRDNIRDRLTDAAHALPTPSAPPQQGPFADTRPPVVFNCLTNCRASTARGFARPRSDVEQASEGETKTKKHRTEQPDDTTEQLLACLGPHVQVHTAPAQSRQHILPPLGYRDENSPRPAVKPIAALPTTPQPMPSLTEGSTARVSSTPRCKSTSRVSPNLLL
jgi:hypothetical protein